MTEKNKEMCHNIADYYGEKHQMLKAIEEMAELTQAIIKYIENPCEWDAFCGELADVNIMIEQLNYLVTKWVEPRTCNGISDVDHRIDLKLKRQMKRIDMEVKYYE